MREPKSNAPDKERRDTAASRSPHALRRGGETACSTEAAMRP